MEQGRTPHQGGDPPERHSDLVKAMRLATVTEDGEERIRPDLMAFLMQAAQASHLAKLRSLEESRIPLGSFSIGLTVSAKTHIRLNDPLISFSLINDGPNSVYVEVSSKQGEFPIPRSAPVLSGETFSHDAIYPVIESIMLDVVAATSAAVRIKGKTGTRMP